MLFLHKKRSLTKFQNNMIDLIFVLIVTNAIPTFNKKSPIVGNAIIGTIINAGINVGYVLETFEALRSEV